MKSQKRTIITAVICLSVGMSAFSQEEKTKERKERPSPEKMFEKLDTDKDGLIKKEEIENERLLKRFDKIDANSDGSITLEELKASSGKGKGKKKKKSEDSDESEE